MKEIIITENEAGQRLDKFLAKYLKNAPKSFYYKMLRKKNIVLNGKKVSGQEKLCEGDALKLFLSDDTIEKFSQPADGISVTAPCIELDIVYEDKDILLINKPAGMLSQKAEAEDVSLVEYIIGYLKKSGQLSSEDLRAFRPSICNRLDRNTTGIVAAGKSLYGLQTMGELFRDRSIRKYYRCLVSGRVTEPAHMKGYLVKDEGANKVAISELGDGKEGSQPIETYYRPLSWCGEGTYLEVHLITGRTHQIRAHLASQGHPILGDYKYGDRKVNEKYRRQYGLSCQLLHAYRLEMPVLSGKSAHLSGRHFTAPLSEQFQKILGDLEWEHGIQED